MAWDLLSICELPHVYMQFKKRSIMMSSTRWMVSEIRTRYPYPGAPMIKIAGEGLNLHAINAGRGVWELAAELDTFRISARA